MASEEKVSEEEIAAVQSWMEEILDKKYTNFWEEIRDGLELCELLNKIKPGTCTKMKQNTKIAYFCIQNLTIFRNGCIAIGIPEGRVVESTQVYKEDGGPPDKQAVVTNLYALSGMSSKYGFKGPVLV